MLFESPDSGEFNCLLLLLVEDFALKQAPEYLEDEEGLGVLLTDEDLFERVKVLLSI